MSHVARLKVELKIKKEVLHNERYIKTLEKILKMILGEQITLETTRQIRDYRGNITKYQYTVLRIDGLGYPIYIDIVDGEVTITTEEYLLHRNPAIVRRIKQAMIMASQLMRYKKFKVKESGKRLVAEVLV